MAALEPGRNVWNLARNSPFTTAFGLLLNLQMESWRWDQDRDLADPVVGAFLPRWVLRGEGVDRDSHNSDVSLPTASARMCPVVTRFCRYRTILLIFPSCFFLRKVTLYLF